MGKSIQTLRREATEAKAALSDAMKAELVEAQLPGVDVVATEDGEIRYRHMPGLLTRDQLIAFCKDVLTEAEGWTFGDK